MILGTVRLSAQTSGSPYDAYFSLNVLGQDYRNAADRERAVKESLSAANFDVNHNGKLDDQEYDAWQKRVRTFVQQQPELMKRFDRNRDGVLSDREWDFAYGQIFEAKPRRPRPNIVTAETDQVLRT